MKKTKKIIASLLVIGAISSTLVNASPLSSYGIGSVWYGKNAYTGSYTCRWISAQIKYGNTKSAEYSTGDPDSTTTTSLWVQTSYITGVGGTASGYHQYVDSNGSFGAETSSN